MGYMRVKHKDESRLVLLREPTLFWIVNFIVALVGSFGIFFFGSEPLIFKLLIALVAIGLSCILLDNYEICEFDKTKSEVRTTSLHWCQFWVGNMLGFALQPNVVAKLEDIRDVRVEEQSEGNSVKGYQVILILETGQELGITEVFTTDDISTHDKIKEDIKQFLKDIVKTQADTDNEAEGSDDDDGDDDNDDDDDSTEDDFEQISHSELESLKEISTGGGDAFKEGGAADGGDVMGATEAVDTEQCKGGDEASS